MNSKSKEVTLTKSSKSNKKKTSTLINEFKEEVHSYRYEMQELNNRVDSLEHIDVESIKDQILPEVQNQIEKSLRFHEEKNWDESCIRELKAEELKLCISGLAQSNSPPSICLKNFCQEKLCMTEDDFSKLDIKTCFFLTKPKAEPSSTIKLMVIFGNTYSRNQCLKLRSKLVKGVWISTQVPKRYLDKNREFEEQAKHLRLSENVATKIHFEGPSIQLLYGTKPTDKDKKVDYRIFDEWKPKYQKPAPLMNHDAPPTSNTSIINKITNPTRIILKEAKSEPSLLEVQTKISPDLVSSDDAASILDIKATTSKTAFIISCKDHQTAKHISDKYNGNNFLGHKIAMKLLNF